MRIQYRQVNHVYGSSLAHIILVFRIPVIMLTTLNATTVTKKLLLTVTVPLF